MVKRCARIHIRLFLVFSFNLFTIFKTFIFVAGLKKESSRCCGCFSLSKRNDDLDTDVGAKDLELLKQARTKARNKYKVESPEVNLKKRSAADKLKLAVKASPKKSSGARRKSSKRGEEIEIEDLDEIPTGQKKNRSLKRKNTKGLKKGGKVDDASADEKRKKDIDSEEDINNSKGNSKKKISKKKPSINTSGSPVKSGTGKKSPNKRNGKETNTVLSKKSPKRNMKGKVSPK